MDGACRITGFFQKLTRGRCRSVLIFLDEAGRQLPGEALQRRTILPHQWDAAVGWRRIQHGAPFLSATGEQISATNVIVQKEHLVFTTGEKAISSWESSPGKRRYFCSGCGSPLYSHGEKTKHIVSVRCGSLDGDLTLRPSVHAFVASKANWVEITDDLPQHPEYFA